MARVQGDGFGDELLEESDSLNNLFELLGEETSKLFRFVGDGKLREGIKDKAILTMALGTGFMTGGVTKLITQENTAVVNGVVMPRYTEGFNIQEEIVEGGLPFCAGMLLGELVYQLRLKKGEKGDLQMRATHWMLFGSFGYLGMYFAGDILHQIFNVPNIHLFK